MKDLYDIYEDDYTSNNLEESLLSKTSDKIKNLNFVDAFVEWLCDTQPKDSVSKEEYIKQIIDNGDGTFDIDCRKYTSYKHSLDQIVIPKEGLPEWLEIRNIYVSHRDLYIRSWNGDLSSLNFTVFTRTNKLGNIELDGIKVSEMTVGAVKGNHMRIYAPEIQSLKLDSNCDVKELDICNCKELKSLSNIPSCCEHATLPQTLVEEVLKGCSFVGKSTKINVV